MKIKHISAAVSISAIITLSCFRPCSAKGQISPEARAVGQAAEAPIHQKQLHAEELVASGHYLEAATLLETILIDHEGHDDIIRTSLGDLYTRLKRPDDVLRVLAPLWDRKNQSSTTQPPGTYMLYILALLDKHMWGEAVNIYKSACSSNLVFSLPHRGAYQHGFPAVDFFADSPQYRAMRSQAELILGATGSSLEYRDETPYLLKHLREAVRLDPWCADAHLAMGLVLLDSRRLVEARSELAKARRYAPQEELQNVDIAFRELKAAEDLEKSRITGEEIDKRIKSVSGG